MLFRFDPEHRNHGNLEQQEGTEQGLQHPDLLLPHQPTRPPLGSQGQRAGGRRERRDVRGATLGSDSVMILLNSTQAAGAGGKHQLQRLGQVLQQVEAVRDLHRPGRAAASAFGIRT